MVMSRGNATNENTRKPEKVDSWDFNSITAKLLSKFTCKPPTAYSLHLGPIFMSSTMSNLFFNIKISNKQSVLKNQLPNKNFAIFCGILWIFRDISKLLFYLSILWFLVGHWLGNAALERQDKITVSLIICAINLLSSRHTILLGYFTVNVQPLNRQFYDKRK